MSRTPGPAARAVREVVERIDVDALVAEVEADLRDEPAYRRFVRDDRQQDRGRAVIRWNLELFARWLVDGQPPARDDLERIGALVRIRASEGLPIEEGLQVYRRGTRLAWETVLRMASGEERQALLEGSPIYVAYVDLVSDAFLAAYADVGQRPAPDEAAARALLERLRAGTAPGTDEQDQAERLGVALDGAHRPFAIAIRDAPIRAHVELAAALRATGTLAAVDGTTVVGLAAGPIAEGRVELPSASVVGVGAATDGPGLAAAFSELATLVALGLDAGRSGPLDPDDFLVELLLGQAPRAAARIGRRVLDGLDEELAATLRALVAHDFDRAAAAAALPVHRNTLRARIGRIEQRTGLDLARTDDRGLAWLAVRRRPAG